MSTPCYICTCDKNKVVTDAIFCFYDGYLDNMGVLLKTWNTPLKVKKLMCQGAISGLEKYPKVDYMDVLTDVTKKCLNHEHETDLIGKTLKDCLMKNAEKIYCWDGKKWLFADPSYENISTLDAALIDYMFEFKGYKTKPSKKNNYPFKLNFKGMI